MDIINKAYKEAGGIGEFEGYTMNDDNKKCIKFPNGIKDFLCIKNRKNIRIPTKDIDYIVFEYRETENKLLYEALIEHYIDILIKLSKRYRDKATTIKYRYNDNYGYDDDLLSEGFTILHKCIYKYDNSRPNSSFTSYFLGEFRNHMIETCRRKYFPVVKIPAQIYKEHRKKISSEETSHLLGTETGLVQRVGGCISDADESNNFEDKLFEIPENNEMRFYNDVQEEHDEIMKILNKYLTKEEIFIFCAINGFYMEKMKGIDVASKLNISTPAVSKKNKKIKNILANTPEIQKLYNYYKENNIF